ncbi:MAG: DUF4190 domain-containing protein [Patescibacteria group bacterium]
MNNKNQDQTVTNSITNQQLLDYIKQQIQEGVSQEIITSNLISRGWQLSDINDAFSKSSNQIFSKQINPTSSIGNASKNIKATISLVLGIIGLIAWLVPLIGAPITIIGLFLGIMGLKSIKRSMAIVGIVLSSIGLFATIVNVSIEAYQGEVGKNYLINKFLNGENYKKNIAQPSPQQLQQQTTSQNNVPDTLEKQPYYNTKHGLKLNVPKGWRIDESGQFNLIVAFINTETDWENYPSKEEAFPFNTNITVGSESAQGYDLDGYINVAQESFKLLTDYKSIENKKVTVNGMQSQILGGTFTQGGVTFRILQLAVEKNGQIYVVTGTTLESTWSQYKDLIESSLMTLTIN